MAVSTSCALDVVESLDPAFPTDGADAASLSNGVVAVSQITAIGPLLSGFFKDLSVAAADGNDRVLSDPGTGEIFYDANGSGAGQRTLFAKASPGIALDFQDFFVTP
jgi:hypothetical protein